MLLALFRLGIAGFAPKTSKSAIIEAAIRLVLAGGHYLPPRVVELAARQVAMGDGAAPAGPTVRLTERQIDVLKLINPYLVNRREAALSGVLDPDFIDTATSEELTILIEGYSQPDNGRLAAFGHVISSVCRSLALR